jgi:cellulose synthase/poly-beta-1,6-N-acetylglucosamine synthase-like glycosyltransferase
MNLLATLWLLAQNPISNYWHKATDRTFSGIYHANAFDLAMMIPYFIVLIILAVYGLHRYWLVYDYYKYRKNVPGPPPDVAQWPRVTVQLPIYNERYVIERLVEAVSRFDYPPELLDIQVLDDSTDETREVARACVERHAAHGIPISYIHRTNREGFKAGALENGLKTARGEFIAIFDADFIPESDFLRRTIPYFQNPKIGMAQTRWTYLNRDYSLLTQVETILLDGHFVVEHGARSRRGTFFNFNGTAGVWRCAAIDSAGGWEHDTLTEDTDLSYRAQLKGWKFLYLPDIECSSELPVDMNGFKAQQARWAKGLMQTAKKILPKVFRSNAPWHVKAEAFFHLTANISYPLMVLFSAMLLPAMIVRFYQGWFQMLLIDLPLFLASTCSISSFYLVAQNLVPHFFLHAIRDGHWNRHLHPQRPSRSRSHFRHKKRICPHAKIQDRRQERHLRIKKISQQSRLDALRGNFPRPLFRVHCRLRHYQPEFRHHPLPASFCLGLPLHRLHVPRPNLLRAPPLRRKRPRNAPRLQRRPRLLARPTFL